MSSENIKSNAAGGALIGGAVAGVAASAIVPKDIDRASTVEKVCAAAIVLPAIAAGAAVGGVAGAIKGAAESLSE